jgi:two-component system sensor histidine kinase ChiS
MVKIFNCFLAFTVLLFFTFCSQTKKEQIQESLNPKILSITGYTVSNDSIIEPVKILGGPTSTRLAGKPKVTLTNSNSFSVDSIYTIDTVKKSIVIPGKDKYELPKIFTQKGKITLAGCPEIILAKDMSKKDINPANFSTFEVLHGLRNNSIRCMLQDKCGNIWFGTSEGVTRYDGKYFSNFTEKEGLPSNLINCIFEDSKGNFWFGSHGAGIFFYDGKTFTNFSESNGQVNNYVKCILEDKLGNIWFGSHHGSYKYDGKSFTNYGDKQGLDNYVYSMKEDKSGNIWFGGSRGLFQYDGEKFNCYWCTTIDDFAFDKSGNIWWEQWGSVCRFNGKFISKFMSKKHINFVPSSGIIIDKQENIWIATELGACRFDGKIFTNFTEKEGLVDNDMRSILEDRSGNIWLGTSSGVSLYNGKKFTNFTDKEGLGSKNVNCICKGISNNLWIGTEMGVSFYDGICFSNLSDQEGLPVNGTNHDVLSILEDESKPGNFWFGTYGGLVYYDGKYIHNYYQLKNDSNYLINFSGCYSLTKDNSNNIWIGVDRGIIRYDGKYFMKFSQKEGFCDENVNVTIKDAKGNLWIGTDGGGLALYDGKKFTFFTEKQGLAKNIVTSLMEDESGNIWIGMQGGGVSCYNGKSIATFTEKEGLINNNVRSILKDKHGNIWIGTRKGISKLSADKVSQLQSALISRDFNSIKTPLFYNYSNNDGFVGWNCKKNSILQDEKENIWWGTSVMLTRYDPTGDIIDTTPPSVNLTGIKMYNEDIYWPDLGAVKIDSTGNEIINHKIEPKPLSNGFLLEDITFDSLSRFYLLPSNLSLPYNNNNLSFNFIGVQIQSRNYIKYQYKLEGLDPGWSTITDRTEASYGNLPNGSYTFKVKAMNQSGIWSTPLEYKFEVRPPWNRTWWAYTTYIFAFIAAIRGYLRNRTKKLEKEKQKLEKTVEERTAEVVKQKHLLEEKNKEVMDSITYARRIQSSLMPTEKYISRILGKKK